MLLLLLNICGFCLIFRFFCIIFLKLCIIFLGLCIILLDPCLLFLGLYILCPGFVCDPLVHFCPCRNDAEQSPSSWWRAIKYPYRTLFNTFLLILIHFWLTYVVFTIESLILHVKKYEMNKCCYSWQIFSVCLIL